MLHVAIDADLERALAELAARVGEAPEELARQALKAYMEDLADYATAVEAAREFDPTDTVSLDDLLKRYDVAG